MGRVRANSTVRIHRKTGQDFSGDDTRVIQVPRARARMLLRNDSIVSADGVLRGTDGTLVFDAFVDVVDGDLIQVLDGPHKSAEKRYYVESVEEDQTVSGRVVAKRATVSLDRGRGVSL